MIPISSWAFKKYSLNISDGFETYCRAHTVDLIEEGNNKTVEISQI